MAKRNKGIEETPDIVTILNNQFRLMVAQSSATRRMMKEDHELYYSDVDGTRTQFTNAQLDFIQQRYDIPISTKISWAVIEQMIAFVTGGKPHPRLLASTSVTADFTNLYEQAIIASLYECHFNRELTMCVRDTFAGGIGWLYVRPNDFYAETTFGVVGEYKPWSQVFVDPHARKPDFSDAEYMCIVDVLPKGKAERTFDITITDADVTNFAPDIMWGVDTNIVPIVAGWPFDTGMTANRQDRYVWTREFYSKQQVNVYISDTGEISSKKPKPLTVPNPEKEQLMQQIVAMQEQMQAGVQNAKAADTGIAQGEEELTTPGTGLITSMNNIQGSQRAWEQATDEMDQMGQQMQQLQIEYAKMPDTIVVYLMETLSGEEIQVRNFFKRNQKMVKRWLLVNNRLIEENIIPCDEYPLVPFTLSVANRPDKIYGIMHYIKDIVKALNKFWSLLIYDMQTSAHRKVLYPKGSITDPSKAEKEWSKPNAFIEYTPNPELPNGGQPMLTEGSSLNPAIQSILGMLQNLLEYITGISSIMQGQPNAATPDTFGGIQTMQSFGSQRVKLYSRWLEDAMERFTYVYVSYLQAYAPKDKVLTYFDDNGDQQEIQLLENSEDVKFKVRVNMTASLPTARAMAAQLLGVLGGQTKDPHVQQLLTQYMVEYLDLPESQKIREEVDAVKNLTGQLEQVQGQVEELTSQNKQLQQQIFQKNLEVDYAKAKAKLQAETEIASTEIEAGKEPTMPSAPNMAEQEEVPF